MTTVRLFDRESRVEGAGAKGELATLNDRPTIRVRASIAELAPLFCRPLLKERNSRVLDYLFF